MGRREYQHLVLKCNKGINQQRDLASLEECAEALNVWAPDGAIEQRPGYTGAFALTHHGSGASVGTLTYISQNSTSYVTASNGDTLSLNSWPVNGAGAFSRGYYVGFASIADLDTNDHEKLIGFGIRITAENRNPVTFKAEYYSSNTNDWKYLRVTEIADNGNGYGGNSDAHLKTATDTAQFAFVPPGDWATTTVSSTTAYFIRFQVVNAGAAGLDSAVTISNDAPTRGIGTLRDGDAAPTRSVFAAQFPLTKRYLYLSNKVTTDVVGGSTIDLENYQSTTGLGTSETDERGSIAVVPQYGEAFVAGGGKIARIHVNTGMSVAAVESADFAVGTSAPYDPELVIQLENFPESKYITFFKGRLWCAGIKDRPYEVRWTAAAPFHKVWPTLSAEPLMEDDNSPITGMSSYGENLVVFKNDSVWQMMNTGPNSATLVEHYSPIKIVSGVGCVSNSSIEQVRGNLLFLAEDGVYAFDGTPNIKKMSDRVGKTIASITPGRRRIACSAHWKAKSLYLLSIAVDGSYYNNRTLVYDYKNDAWWEWDIPAQHWLVDEDGFDNETLYFIDSFQCVFQMDTGNHDHGSTISSHIVSQRLGENTNARRTLRQIEVLGDNKMGSITVEAIANDDTLNSDSGAIVMTDSSEATYGSATDGVDKYVIERRRARRIAFRKQADWFQVKVSSSAYNTPMMLAGIDVAFAGELKR